MRDFCCCCCSSLCDRCDKSPEVVRDKGETLQETQNLASRIRESPEMMLSSSLWGQTGSRISHLHIFLPGHITEDKDSSSKLLLQGPAPRLCRERRAGVQTPRSEGGGVGVLILGSERRKGLGAQTPGCEGGGGWGEDQGTLTHHLCHR